MAEKQLDWPAQTLITGFPFYDEHIGSSLSAVLLFFVPGLDQSTYALAFAGIILGGLFVTLIQSLIYLRSFPTKRQLVAPPKE